MLLTLTARNMIINTDQIATAEMDLHGGPEGNPGAVLHITFGGGKEEIFKDQLGQDLWKHLLSITDETL